MEKSQPKDQIYSFLISFFYQFLFVSNLKKNSEFFANHKCAFMQKIFVFYYPFFSTEIFLFV